MVNEADLLICILKDLKHIYEPHVAWISPSHDYVDVYVRAVADADVLAITPARAARSLSISFPRRENREQCRLISIRMIHILVRSRKK